MRIAMWSGPRNLSTAMMYAFAARSDCTVVDEPFYASYLAATGLQHPMRNEILASQPQDPETVIRKITGSIRRCCTDRVSSVNTSFCHDHGYA